MTDRGSEGPLDEREQPLAVWCRDYPEDAAREIEQLRDIARNLKTVVNERRDLHRFDRDRLTGELEAMRPVVDAVRAMRNADGLHPVLIGNVMEAIERYEAWNV